MKRCVLTVPLALSIIACSGGKPRDPISTDDVALELAFCRSWTASPGGNTQLRLGDARGLRNEVVIDRTGVEMDPRVHPDGVRIAFARERTAGRPETRDLFVGWLDLSQPEVTVSGEDANDSPSWSPDGETLVFSSTRGGQGRRLWLAAPDGRDLRMLNDDGSEQDEPDWSRALDRIVFSSVTSGPDRRARLYTIAPDGRAPLPLTDGGPVPGSASFTTGDMEPAWSPDGRGVLFVRRIAQDEAVLLHVDVTTKVVTPVTATSGEDRRPRWSPHGDRIFFIGTRPMEGVADPRLWTALPDGSDPQQIFLDPRFDFPGLDPLPSMTARYTGPTEMVEADVNGGLAEIAVGFRTQGERESLTSRDGLVLGIATVVTPDAEAAGLNLRFPLPVMNVDEIDAIEVEAHAALTDVDAQSVLRLAVNDVVNRRNDVAVEVPATDESFRTMRCSFSSLAHVDRDRILRIEVIGVKEQGRQGELQIDYVAVRVRRRTSDS